MVNQGRTYVWVSASILREDVTEVGKLAYYSKDVFGAWLVRKQIPIELGLYTYARRNSLALKKKVHSRGWTSNASPKIRDSD